jgi:hypothetical protein
MKEFQKSVTYLPFRAVSEVCLSADEEQDTVNRHNVSAET